MKKLYILSVFLLFAVPSHAQLSRLSWYSIGINNMYNSSGNDILPRAGGDMLVHGSSVPFLMRTDQNGVKKWIKSYKLSSGATVSLGRIHSCGRGSIYCCRKSY